MCLLNLDFFLNFFGLFHQYFPNFSLFYANFIHFPHLVPLVNFEYTGKNYPVCLFHPVCLLKIWWRRMRRGFLKKPCRSTKGEGKGKGIYWCTYYDTYATQQVVLILEKCNEWSRPFFVLWIIQIRPMVSGSFIRIGHFDLRSHGVMSLVYLTGFQ